MKKFISIFIVATLLTCCFTATAFASNQTVLTTTVPDATYTLNIPADQEIEFGTISQKLGNITITDSSGFAEGKDVKVTCSHDMFINEGTETTIPYSLSLEFESMSGDAISGSDGTHNLTTGVFFEGKKDGSVRSEAYYLNSPGLYNLKNIVLNVKSEDWGKALGGNYYSTITFTSEVVVSE